MQHRPLETHLRLVATLLSLWSLLAYLTSEARLGFEAPLVLTAAMAGALLPQRLRRKIPEKLWTGVLLALLALVLGLTYRAPSQVVVYLYGFVRWLLVAKLWTRSSVRDELQVLLLAFFILLGASIFTYGYQLALFVSGFVLLAPAALYLTAVAGPGVNAPTLPRGFYWRSLSVGTLVVAGGAFLFILLPRVSSSLVTFDFLARDSAPAFPLQMRLDERGALGTSGRVVFRVHVDPADAPVKLWRVQSLDAFDGRKWWRNFSRDESLARLARGVFADDPQAWKDRGADAVYRLELAPILLPALIVPQALGLEDAGMAIRGSLSRVTRSRDGTLSFDREGEPPGRVLPVQYEIAYQTRAPKPPALSARSRERLTTLPENLDPRIGALAHELSLQGESAQERADAVERYLSENYFYSLDREPAESADPLAAFLFEARAGHCEYFASAAAVLLRTMDVPARVVAGFAVGAQDDGGVWVVREQDAHSWVEAYDPQSGWLTIDPSPRDLSAEHARLGPWLLWWGAARERADWYWYEFVLRYSLREQFTLAERLIEGAGSLWLSRPRGGDLPRIGTPAFGLMGALKVIAAVFALSALFWFLLAGKRGEGRNRSESTLARLLRPLRREARRRGIAVGHSVTPLELHRMLGAQLGPEARAALGQWIRSYNQARFGGQDWGPERRRSLARAWKGVRRLLRERPPRALEVRGD